MNRKILILLSILLTAVLVFFLLPSDEKKIRHNLQSLTKYCSSTPEDTSLAILTQVSKAAKLCTESCSIDVKSFDIQRQFTRKDISDHMLMMKKMLPDTRFVFNDTKISFPEEKKALITTTLSLQGKTKNQRFTDAYELNVTALKTDGDWLFNSFIVVEFMEQ